MDRLLLDSAADLGDMYRMGRKVELPRTFNRYSCVGFSTILGCNWEFILITGTLTLANGGVAGSIWMFLIVLVGMSLVMSSMAELASMFPDSGAQYVWVSVLAPRSIQKYLSFVVGWLACLGWQSCMALASYSGSQQFQSIISLTDSTYEPQAWHALFLTIGVLAFSTLTNIYLIHKLPLFEGVMIVLHVMAFMLIVVILWIMGPRMDARTAFTNFDNDGGWRETPLACLTGMSPFVISLIGVDSAVHVAEEIRNATSSIPMSMIVTALLSYTCAMVMAMAVMFNVGDVGSSASTAVGQSYVQIILNATNSPAMTIVCVSCVTVLLCACGVNQATVSSRQLYAFARDQGVPFSDWLSTVNSEWNVPVNSVMATLLFAGLLSLVTLTKVNVFSHITSLSITGLLSSYLICIACRFWHRLIRGADDNASAFRFGRKMGLLVNGLSIVFLSTVLVFSLFPSQPQPDAVSMNWSILVVGAAFLSATVYYHFYGRYRYISPLERARKHD